MKFSSHNHSFTYKTFLLDYNLFIKFNKYKMKQILIIFFFLIPKICLPFGNWIEYYSNNGEKYYYKDVKRIEQGIEFYNMKDSKRPDIKGVYCIIDKRIADCENFSLKYLEYNFFKGPLCIGQPESVPKQMIKSFSWKKNDPESTDFKIIKNLCEKFTK